jgi:hypothetical protein
MEIEEGSEWDRERGGYIGGETKERGSEGKRGAGRERERQKESETDTKTC